MSREVLAIVSMISVVVGLLGLMVLIIWLCSFIRQVYENKRNLSGLFNHLGLEITVESTNIIKEETKNVDKGIESDT